MRAPLSPRQPLPPPAPQPLAPVLSRLITPAPPPPQSPFPVEDIIVSMAKHADLIYIFFDPIGQALCDRTMNVIERLNQQHSTRMRYFLSKADTVQAHPHGPHTPGLCHGVATAHNSTPPATFAASSASCSHYPISSRTRPLLAGRNPPPPALDPPPAAHTSPPESSSFPPPVCRCPQNVTGRRL